MGLVSWFSVSIFFHFCCFVSAQGQNTSSFSCTKDFQCGKLGNLSFPFYNSTQNLDCGLLKVDCGATPNPILELQGVKYQAFYKDSIFIKLKDPILENLLKTNSCQTFDKNLSLPNSPSITYRVYPFLTLFKCNTSQEVFSPSTYHSYNGCNGFILYYNKNISTIFSLDFHVPSGCSLINLPMLETKPEHSSFIFDMLTDIVTLSYTVSDECNQCHYGGGKCQTDNNTTSKFHCDAPKVVASKRKLKLGSKLIVTVAVFVGAFLGLCTIGFVLWYCKMRKECSPSFISRNASAVSMIHRELEGSSEYLGIPVFSYRELEEATSKFHSSRRLGDGGYGTVYHGKLGNGKEVAVKRLYENNQKQMQQFINEIKILTQLRHLNLVILYGCTSRRSRELFLVYEYIPNGTIADHLRGHRAKEKLLTWHIRLKIAIETASALAYLHASDIIHRDVKTNNILLDDDFCVKLADFGLSKRCPNDMTHISTAPQGTPGYVDPQYQECYQLTDKSDVYSFGVVLVELISSKPAIDMNRDMHEISLANFAINRILKSAFDEVIDPSLGLETDAEVKRMAISVAEVAFRCLQVVRDMRPTMEEVLGALTAIKEGERKHQGDFTEPRSVEVRRHGSETEDAVLLKKSFPDSPDTVIDTWVSSSTTTSTGSIIYRENC